MSPPISLIQSATTTTVGMLSLVVQLVTVLIWPLVLSIFLITHRGVLNRLFSALALLAESANKIKLWQVEIERTIDQEVDNAARAVKGEVNIKPEVPKGNVIAAAKVESLIREVPDLHTRKKILNSVQLRMLSLGDEYDKIRISMPSGRERTIAMDKIAAQMRTLGVAAKPWLEKFSTDENSAGIRLCAIAILQMTPDPRFLVWLGERFTREQPFVFYQASLALMQAVRTFGDQEKQILMTTISSALDNLKAFTKGTPDQNSINVLEAALGRLRHLNA